MKITVYTTITGGFDYLMPHADTPGARFVCLTDRPSDPSLQGRGWEVCEIPHTDEGWTPRAVAKWSKMHPHRLFRSADLTVFVDGNKQIVSDLTPLIEDLGSHPYGLFTHPAQANTVKSEAVKLIRRLRCEDWGPRRIKKQVRHYEQCCPQVLGSSVFAGYVHFRRMGCDLLNETMEDWWSQVVAFQMRDQIALAYVLMVSGLRPYVWPKNVFGRYFVRYRHGTDDVEQYRGMRCEVPEELQSPWGDT